MNTLDFEPLSLQKYLYQILDITRNNPFSTTELIFILVALLVIFAWFARILFQWISGVQQIKKQLKQIHRSLDSIDRKLNPSNPPNGPKGI
jgi:hypothetical protein